MPRYRLRTLLILMAIVPPLVAVSITPFLIAYQYSTKAVPPNVIIHDIDTGEIYVGPPK